MEVPVIVEDEREMEEEEEDGTGSFTLGLLAQVSFKAVHVLTKGTRFRKKTGLAEK